MEKDRFEVQMVGVNTLQALKGATSIGATHHLTCGDALQEVQVKQSSHGIIELRGVGCCDPTRDTATTSLIQKHQTTESRR